MSAYHRAMRDLYQRLRRQGFDQRFIHDRILPDWWEDALAEVPANRALAETCLARHLGLRIEQLRDPEAELVLPPLADVRFKRYRNRVDEQVLPATRIAQRAGQLVADLLAQTPPYPTRPASAREVRQAILRENPFVDLSSLLDFCWQQGMVVIHLAETPRQCKGFDGMAFFSGDRPVVVLGSRRDSPPWLTFHLAHELGHILCGHVERGGPPVVDGGITSSCGDDGQEREADDSACEALTGEKRPIIAGRGLTGEQLAAKAVEYGPRRGIEPGMFALVYAKSNDRWAVAQNAIKLLQQASGAHHMIRQRIMAKLDPLDIPESTARFLSVLGLTLPASDNA